MTDPNIFLLSTKVKRILYGDALANIQNVLSGNLGSVPDNASYAGQGREYLHNQHPDEFEYYACALELIGSDGNQDDDGTYFFSFPVMPESIDETKVNISTIKKTQGGVVVNGNSTFKPFDIMIKGDFGRRFRKLTFLNGDGKSNNNQHKLGLNVDSSANNIIASRDVVVSAAYFDSDYKTGYGNIKILEALIEKSKLQDDNSLPYKLFFYNFSLNSHYMVEAQPMKVYQNQGKNMIWSYDLQLKAIAPASAVLKNGNLDLAKKLQTILNFIRRNNESNFLSESIKSLLGENNTTQIDQILIKQATKLANTGISSSSALQAITQLTANPNSLADFAVNFGQGVLTRR
jgi:hypothetical protein